MPLVDIDRNEIRANNPQFVHLDLGGRGLFDGDVEELVELLKANAHITSLNLCENNIGDKGGQALATLTRIKKLDLSRNNISVKSAQQLAESTIEELDLSENYLKDNAGLIFAEKGRQLKLNISKNRHLNEEIIKKVATRIQYNNEKHLSALAKPLQSTSQAQQASFLPPQEKSIQAEILPKNAASNTVTNEDKPRCCCG